MHIDVHVHINKGLDDETAALLGDVLAGVTQTLNRLDLIGGFMSDIQAALDQLSSQTDNLTAQVQLLPSRVAEDVGNFQAIIQQLADELQTALGNDAADAATIAEKQTMIDDLTAQAQAAVDRINAQTVAVSQAAAAVGSVDPDTSFPPAAPVSPPVEP